MQTFLPYAEYKSVDYLDYKRLGKQRVETYQILRALNGDSNGWVNHPATKMWRGHGHHLALYGITTCDLWIARGYNDTTRPKIAAYLDIFPDTGEPYWFGNEDFHAAHRSNLLAKNPEFYRQYWPDEPDNLAYIWPEPKEHL